MVRRHNRLFASRWMVREVVAVVAVAVGELGIGDMLLQFDAVVAVIVSELGIGNMLVWCGRVRLLLHQMLLQFGCVRLRLDRVLLRVHLLRNWSVVGVVQTLLDAWASVVYRQSVRLLRTSRGTW